MTTESSVVLAAAALTAVPFMACWLYGLTHDQDFSPRPAARVAEPAPAAE